VSCRREAEMSGSLRFIIALAALLHSSVFVLSQTTDATRSIASGPGLQSSQAGVVSSFAITAKDESGASRTSGGDTFIVELEGTRSITASVIDQLSGVLLFLFLHPMHPMTPHVQKHMRIFSSIILNKMWWRPSSSHFLRLHLLSRKICFLHLAFLALFSLMLVLRSKWQEI